MNLLSRNFLFIIFNLIDVIFWNYLVTGHASDQKHLVPICLIVVIFLFLSSHYLSFYYYRFWLI